MYYLQMGKNEFSDFRFWTPTFSMPPTLFSEKIFRVRVRCHDVIMVIWFGCHQGTWKFRVSSFIERRAEQREKLRKGKNDEKTRGRSSELKKEEGERGEREGRRPFCVEGRDGTGRSCS